MKITKDSFIPVINGCIFSPENIISNERIIYYLSNLKDDSCFSEYIFRQIIKISTKELGIKSGYDLYNYVYKDDTFYLSILLTSLIIELFFIIKQYKLLKRFYKDE